MIDRCSAERSRREPPIDVAERRFVLKNNQIPPFYFHTSKNSPKQVFGFHCAHMTSHALHSLNQSISGFGGWG